MSARPVPARVSEGSPSPVPHLDGYRAAVDAARNDPSGFWLELTRSRIAWRRAPTVGLEGDFRSVCGEPLRWFADGVLNVTESCLDRHLAARGDHTALLWEGDEPGSGRAISYRELHAEVCQASNALVGLGVAPGDRVVIYMGMVPELAVAMLACARVGAVHSVVFGGFSAEALRDRVQDSAARVVITQDEGRRGGRSVPLKRVAQEALEGSEVEHCVVVRRTGGEVPWTAGRDVWWHELVGSASAEHAAVARAAEDPLYILYTSGSTGRPKGLVHTCGGYLTYVNYTCQVTFDLRPDDVFACVADCGWVTGHSYIVYGPLSLGVTSVMFESTPGYPDAGRYWDLVERHGVTVFYTAPTAIRALAAHGAEPVRRHDTGSLRVLGTVGEPIDPDAWTWYFDVVGEGRCTVVDTWWQTETGGHCIAPIAPATPTKPGSATLPLPGILPVLVDDEGHELFGPAQGRLCLSVPWPGQARTVWGDHERFVRTYFSDVPGRYFTGDGARRDADGYYWITGRVDDVINVAGHRMGTAEFEAALIHADEVAEAAVVGFPHALKGTGVFAFIVLQPGHEAGGGLPALLDGVCRVQIGAHARVDRFQVVPGLPKTRSGKVMRRILRQVAAGRADDLGDVSTLADPSVVAAIVHGDLVDARP